MSLRPPQGPGGRLITLYAACTREFADRLCLDPEVIIAYTLAHEVGHQLLPDGRHGLSGVMRESLAQIDIGEWRRAARGGMRFDKAELKLMKEALAALATDPQLESNRRQSSDRSIASRRYCP